MENKSILFVDDEINILKAIRRGLIDTDYNCFFAASGNEALEIMENNDIGVIVSDMRMPGMSGLDLLKIIKEKYPKVVKMVLSGYAQLPQVIATINQIDVFKFILKPWDLDDEFLEIIGQAFEYHNYLREKESLSISLEKRYNLYLNILKSTDDKFVKYDKQIENIKLISKKMLELMSSIVLDDENKDAAAKNRAIRETYSDYLNSIATAETYFTPHILVKILIGLLKDNEYKSRLKNDFNEIDEVRVNGNAGLIAVVMAAIIKISFYCEIINNFSIKFEMDEENLRINMNGYYNEIHTGHVISIRALDEIMSVLYIICGKMNCEIKMQENPEAVDIKLIFNQGRS